MNVRSILADFFAKYGRTITVEGADFRVLLSPRDGKTPDFQKLCAGELGTARQGEWLLLAPAEAEAVRPGARLRTGEAEYAVHSAGCFHLGEEPLYRWALLQQTSKEVS